MSKQEARLCQLGDNAFAVIGEDGLTNFGIVKGADGSALLIDGDIRKPRLHSIFNLPNKWGLGNLLEDDCPICPAEPE